MCPNGSGTRGVVSEGVVTVQGHDSHRRGGHRHHVPAAVVSAQRVLLLQPQDHGHVGRPGLLAVQTQAQVWVTSVHGWQDVPRPFFPALSRVWSFVVDHLPDKEMRRRKPKKTFEIDFSDDVNFDTYFRTTRVRMFLLSYQQNNQPSKMP